MSNESDQIMRITHLAQEYRAIAAALNNMTERIIRSGGKVSIRVLPKPDGSPNSKVVEVGVSVVFEV